MLRDEVSSGTTQAQASSVLSDAEDKSQRIEERLGQAETVLYKIAEQLFGGQPQVEVPSEKSPEAPGRIFAINSILGRCLKKISQIESHLAHINSHIGG